jgi:type VI secretion system secreted protein VgrG
MRTGFTQDAQLISVSTAFGKDKLLVESFSGTEELSRPFGFSLSMKSGEVALDPATIVGTAATVTVKHPDGMTRYFNGIISRFTQSGLDADFAYYSAEMVPALWLLSLSRDRKIWQNQTAVQIIEAVLTGAGVTFEKKLKGSYDTREYCVQYDESPLDFITRLMEQEGIFYFFTFASGAHTMVLADDPTAFADCSSATLAFRGRSDNHNWPDSMLRFEASGRLVTQTFTGADFDYTQPSTALTASAAGSGGRGTVYDYPHLRNTVDGGKKLLNLQVQASQLDGERRELLQQPARGRRVHAHRSSEREAECALCAAARHPPRHRRRVYQSFRRLPGSEHLPPGAQRAPADGARQPLGDGGRAGRRRDLDRRARPREGEIPLGPVRRQR